MKKQGNVRMNREELTEDVWKILCGHKAGAGDSEFDKKPGKGI